MAIVVAGKPYYLKNVHTKKYLRVTLGLSSIRGTRLSLDTIVGPNKNDYAQWMFVEAHSSLGAPHYLQTVKPVTYPDGTHWEMNADVDLGHWNENTPIVVALGTPSQVWQAVPDDAPNPNPNLFYLRSILGDFLKLKGDPRATFDLYMAADEHESLDPNVGKTTWVVTRRRDLPIDTTLIQWIVEPVV